MTTLLPASSPPWIPADQVYARVSFDSAIQAVRDALGEHFDPADDFVRGILDVANGQLLLMPTESPDFVGVKIATVAPDNPRRGLDRIQGVYVLMDAETLTPVALMDGIALTALRTPAVSAAAAVYLAPERVDHVVVFGSGPQARGHIEAIQTIREVSRITIVARHEGRAAALAAEVAASGIDARVGTPDAVREAQLIVCATTASTALFDGTLVQDDSCTIAVGSHEPNVREIDSALMARAQIVVEDVSTALREAGDVIFPVSEGSVDASTLIPLRDIATGQVTVDRDRPRVFKSVGMSWQDLVVAAAVHRAR